MMPDHGDRTDNTLPPAERAVRYMLETIRLNPDLRYLLLHTQAMRLLLDAEAFRLSEAGVPMADQEVLVYTQPADHPEAKRESRLAVYRDLLDGCAEAAEQLEGSDHRADQRVRDKLLALIARADAAR
jgi:hypothetical protein